MTPKLMVSELTGRYYIVTALNADGSTRTKHDCSETVHQIIAAAVKATEGRMEAQAAAMRQTLQGILNRFDREDTGKGFPERGGEIAWAMASDARGGLSSTTAGEALLDRQWELEEALQPLAAVYQAMTATKYPEHLEADADKPLFATQYFAPQGDFVNAKITYADVRRAATLLEQKGDEA